MSKNRLTPAEVEKLSGASNLLAGGQPEQIKEARRLIAEVLYSAAPTITSKAFGTFTRTPPNWNEE